MIFLKSLIFPLANCFYGFLIVFLLRCFLLTPKSEIRISGKRLPLTPGFLYRKRNQVIKLMQDTLNNYLKDCQDTSQLSRISVWENRIFRNVWERMESVDNIKFLPHFITSNIRYGIALVAYELARQFLRTFVPFLLEKYKAQHLIDIVDEKLDMKIVTEYFDKYVYKYMMIFFVGMGLLIGIGNMIVYLIIQ